jgi:predicted house-cleaning noncanonical NTP pyrophosphatase (MazG superfamily)
LTSQAKLVRDKIPQIIRDTGTEPVIRVADAEEFRCLLRAKLVEEVEEFLASDDPNELADILEVLLALAGALGVDQDQLEKLRAAKAFERGGFADRIVWSGNAPGVGGAAYAGLASSA